MTKTQPTALELHAAENISAPEGETPRYSEYAVLTYLDPEGWFIVRGMEVHPYGANYADALSAWEKLAYKQN